MMVGCSALMVVSPGQILSGYAVSRRLSVSRGSTISAVPRRGEFAGATLFSFLCLFDLTDGSSGKTPSAAVTMTS